MDVANTDGQETPISEINISTSDSIKKHVLNETPKPLAAKTTIINSYSPLKKDSLSSSQIIVCSNVSNSSRPSTDSTTVSIYTPLNNENVDSSIETSTTTSKTQSSPIIITTTTNSTASSITEIVKSDLSDEVTTNADDVADHIKKVEELSEKIEETLPQLNTTTATTNSTLTIGVPLARSSPISREFLALQKSLNESKILTEFVTETSAVKAARKARKSCLMIRDNSLNKNSKDRKDRTSDPLEFSNEERLLGKRNMRSQNTEFAQKHMEFLNRVINQQQSGDEQYGSEADEMERFNASVHNEEDDEQTSTSVSNSGIIAFDLADINSLDVRLKNTWQPAMKRGWDSFCWRCRECCGSMLIPCSKCVRSFHKTCVKVSSFTKLDNSWLCPECLAVENALNSPKKTRRPDLSLDMLSELLTFALKRMRSSKGNGKFLFAEGDYSYLSKYIVNPVTFITLEEKIAKKVFRCPEEFYNETKWMVHNAHIITTGFTNHKLLVTAKTVVKICRQETNEIETCAGCYYSANTRSDWFVDVCAQPHILLWAKLKGFPYWPAKAMGIGQNGVINVRFFGKHDRAFVPAKDCYLYSQQDPNLQTGKRSQRELADCIKEVEEHIKNIEIKIGKFNYAPLKTLYDPLEEIQQLEQMMPGVQQYIKRQAQVQVIKPSLQYKIVKTAGNNLSIIKKSNTDETDDNDISHNDSVGNMMDVRDSKDSKTSITSSTVSGGGNGTGSDTIKHVNSPKYEVITKTINNDSDTPKVTAVILKKRRKTTNPNELQEKDETIEPKLMKTAEIVTTPVAVISSSSNKRKQHTIENSPSDPNDSTGSNERHKSKHARTEPRLPILTIKTGTAKIVEQSPREVVEHLSKSNASVTIKKLNKSNVTSAAAVAAIEAVNPITNESPTNVRATRSTAKEATLKPNSTSTTTTNAKDKIVSTSITIPTATTKTVTETTATTMTAQKLTLTEKQDKAEEERNIFRELVPFVEVKEEVVSDAEEDATTTTKATTVNNKNSENLASNINNVPIQPIQKELNVLPLIAIVKEEVMSDEETEQMRLLPNATTANQPTSTTTNNTNDTIRLVGDTIIQRLPSKQATVQPQIIASLAASNTSLATTTTTTTTTSKGNTITHATSSPINIPNSNVANKRITTRSGGVPYGPLPATATNSAANLSLNNKTQKNTNSNDALQLNESLQQQRARKSFPNASQQRILNTMPTTINQSQSNIVLTASPIASPTTLNIDLKRNNNILKSTSMVSIPADIAAQRNISQNTVPMPPLTAVSKTIPVSATVTNTIAGAAPNLSMPRIGSITPAAFANTSNNNSSSNNNNNSSNNITTNNGNNNNCSNVSVAGAFTPPLRLSAPPPLAGLSSSAICNTNTTTNQLQQQPNSTSITSNTLLTTATNVASSSTTNMNLPNAATDSNSTENHLLGDFVTPALANAITEVICRGPPKMAPRPNGPLQSDGSTMFPSEAGPVCRTLVQNAHKLTDFFISVMEDTMCEMSNNDEPSLQAKITLLTIELERMKQAHEQEIAELKRTSDLMLCEMRKSMENEKTRIANEIRKQCELERLRCVEEAKRKQWCANCSREAQFYCCWNTSYCDYPCQQQHWTRHAASCAQTRPNSESNNTASGPNSNNHSFQPMITSASSMNPMAINADGRNKNSSSTVNAAHYNKNLNASKKDKQNVSNVSKNTQMNIASISPIITNSTGDVLKLPSLPSNTSLRPVAVGSAAVNTQTRAASGQQQQQQQQQQRFNISLPISSTAAVNPRVPYTIVQRGNSWELMTSTANTMTPMNTISTVSNSQSLSNLQTQQQQQRTASNLNMSMGRTRNVSVMNYNAKTNGNMRSTQM